jgi:hypothetical protein
VPTAADGNTVAIEGTADMPEESLFEKERAMRAAEPPGHKSSKIADSFDPFSADFLADPYNNIHECGLMR